MLNLHHIFKLLIIIIILSLIMNFIGFKGLIICTLALGIYLYILPKIKVKYRKFFAKKRKKVERRDILDI